MKRLLLLAFSVFIVVLGCGQVLIHSEDFETATGYIPSNLECTDSAGDYFVRTDGSNINAVLTGTTGSFFAAQDIDATPCPGITGGPGVLSINSINVAGYSSLELRVHLAEDDDGSNEDWDAADYVHFDVNIDGGGLVNALWVESTGGTNTEPSIDTDFDGTGDGAALSDTFTQFTSSIVGTGSLMNITVSMLFNSGDEDIAIDNLEIWGTPSGPTISTSGTPVPSLDYFVGNGPSTFQAFSVSATNFTPLSNVTLAVPTTTPQQFMISTASGSGYSTSVVIPTDASGDLTQNVYARLEAGLAVGTYSGDVTVSGGPGATPVLVGLTGEVTQPEVQFSDASSSISETGVSYTLVVSSSISGSHSIDVVASGGSAINGNEYTFATQTVNFTSPTETISVTLNDNLSCDGDQNVIFSFANPVNCSVGTINTLDLNIVDDEQSIIPIDFQGFEGGGWVYDESPAAYSTVDTWDIVGSIGGLTPASGSNFWGTEDLDNPTAGSGVTHTMEFTKDISVYSDVEIDFKWTAAGFNGTDNLKYELVYDGVNQGEVSICSGGGCASGWTNINNSIPNTVTVVDLILKVFQNGNGQFAGFDDVVIRGLSCSTCFEPTVNSVISGSSPTLVTTNSANVSWNLGGDGDNRLLLMRAGSAVESTPQDGSTYNANSVFGTGDQVGSNDYVVYNDNGTSTGVTGLNPGTEYFAEIFEYNCLPGAEDYLTTSSGSDAFVTKPETIDNLITFCSTNNTIEFSWNPPINGNVDGYLVVARPVGAPGGVASLDPSTQSFNLDYSLAPIYSTNSKVLYNGTNTNVVISGLTTGSNYTFVVYGYAIGSTEYRYSDVTSTNQTINQTDVPTYGGFAGDTQVTLNWTLPPVGCWDEVMITVDGIAGVQQAPTGDGSAYTASNTYGAGTAVGPTAGFVVYKGTGTSAVITSLNNTTAYSFEIFVRNGTQWSPGKEIILTPNNATILEPGDLVIIAVNTNISDLPGISDDEVCFVAFELIHESTSIDFTDNGYERVTAGFWGGTEGTIRITRTGGGNVAAGEPICIQGKGNSSTDFDIYVCGVLDNVNWTIENINSGLYNFDTNVDDQIWIMQGGAWIGGGSAHDGQYTGNVLYGWTAVGWEPTFGYSDTKGSTLYEGTKCFTTDLTGLTNHDKVKYTGPMTAVSQLEWIGRVNDVNNWSGYTSNSAYFGSTQDYSGTCITFGVTPATVSDGIWTGTVDNHWFECGNWSDLRVPGDSVDVIIPSSTPDAIVDFTHNDAFLSNDIAIAKNLDINGGSVEILGSSDLIKVNKTLSISNSGVLENKNGGNIEVHRNLEIGSGGTLDMNSSGATSTLTLHRNWMNINSGASPADGFIENNSQVIFAGANITQDVYNVNGEETFHNVTLNKAGQSTVELTGSTDMTIDNVLEFGTGGILDAYTDSDINTKVIINSTSMSAIIGYEPLATDGNYSFNDKLVTGKLDRNVIQGRVYDFPIGDRPAGLNYHPLNLDVTNGNGHVTAFFDPVARRSMDYFDNTNLCAGVPTIVSYHEFSNSAYWNLDGPAGMDYAVTLHPNASTNAPTPASDNDEYKVIKANGGTGSAGGIWPYDQTQNSGPCITTGNYYAAQESFTGFSDFAIIATIPPSVVLPVELRLFEAKTVDRDVELNWITESEINNNLFNLYHSVDGIHWEKINIQNGAGDSEVTLYYSFVHEKPTWGVHYYQLEQVDFDGTNTFSGIVAAEIGVNSDVAVYPIPADNILYIDATYVFDQRSIVIRNDQGQLVSEWFYDNGRVNIQGLSNGIYFISFTTLDSQIVKKFIKSSGN